MSKARQNYNSMRPSTSYSSTKPVCWLDLRNEDFLSQSQTKADEKHTNKYVHPSKSTLSTSKLSSDLQSNESKFSLHESGDARGRRFEVNQKSTPLESLLTNAVSQIIQHRSRSDVELESDGEAMAVGYARRHARPRSSQSQGNHSRTSNILSASMASDASHRPKSHQGILFTQLQTKARQKPPSKYNGIVSDKTLLGHNRAAQRAAINIKRQFRMVTPE
jgi:hypothetical protein